LLVYTESKAVIISTLDESYKIVEQWPIKKK